MAGAFGNRMQTYLMKLYWTSLEGLHKYRENSQTDPMILGTTRETPSFGQTTEWFDHICIFWHDKDDPAEYSERTKKRRQPEEESRRLY